MKLGSLFDGLGGFPFAASRCGITPVWASEVEPFPILVTRARFPAMKHLGDVCKIDGAVVEPVDILTWGSPCQDVSIAGNREGISAARSGLFNQAVRICREMLAATQNKMPRYIVFENVPGLLSSGDDFEYVMAQLQGMGDGFLLDPNILDAQFMGVPQRRRRVFIVGINIKVIERWPGYDFQEGQTNTDSYGQIMLFGNDDDEPDNLQRLRAGLFTLERYFGNKRPSEILPIGKGVFGDYPEGSQAGEGTARDAQIRAGEPDSAHEESSVTGFGESGHGYWREGLQTLWARSDRPSYPSNVVVDGKDVWPDVAGTIVGRADSSPCVDRGQPFVAIGIDEQTNATSEVMGALMAHTSGGAKQYVAVHQNAEGEVHTSEVAYALNQNSNASGRNAPLIAGFNGHKSITGNIQYNEELAPTMEANMPPNVLCAGFMAGQGAKAGSIAFHDEVSPTLKSTESGGNTVPSIVYACRTDQTGANGLGICENVSHTVDGAAGQAVALFENHSQDCRISGPLDVCPTVSQKWGTGGNNTPIAVSLNCRNNSMDNELSGTLQAKANSGGYSLNYINPICVAHGQGNAEICDNLSPALNCNHEQPYIAAGDYIVRRLTPTEVLRLMGLPDGWCSGIHIPEPNDADIDLWHTVWETYRTVTHAGKKAKTRRQIIKWLRKPYADSSVYKVAGNSVAIPCVEFIMRSIIAIERSTTCQSQL